MVRGWAYRFIGSGQRQSGPDSHLTTCSPERFVRALGPSGSERCRQERLHPC